MHDKTKPGAIKDRILIRLASNETCGFGEENLHVKSLQTFDNINHIAYMFLWSDELKMYW
jgi:hypothetical protein